MAKLKKPSSPQKDPHAVALGKLGGAKGGRTRAARLTPDERVRAARLASQARWGRRPKTSPPVGDDVVELSDLRRLQQQVYEAAQALAQQSGGRLDDETAMLGLVHAVGQLAKALATKGTKGQLPSRVKAAVEQELGEVLKAVMVLSQVLGIDLGDARLPRNS